MDILPDMSSSGTQESLPSAGQIPSTPQLSTSHSESPQQNTVILENNYEPRRWNSLTDTTGHPSPGNLQQFHNSLSAAASRETITVANSAEDHEAVGVSDEQLDEFGQAESFGTTSSSPIANATSAWVETLEEHDSDGNRVPFYPGKKLIY